MPITFRESINLELTQISWQDIFLVLVSVHFLINLEVKKQRNLLS